MQRIQSREIFFFQFVESLLLWCCGVCMYALQCIVRKDVVLFYSTKREIHSLHLQDPVNWNRHKRNNLCHFFLWHPLKCFITHLNSPFENVAWNNTACSYLFGSSVARSTSETACALQDLILNISKWVIF